jgi:hypothetical protein
MTTPEGGLDTTPTTKTIGAAGGTLQAGGAVLTIPPGALAGDVMITVTPSASPVPPDYNALSPIFSFAPRGTMFAMPATISLPLSMANASASIYASNTTGGWDGLVTTTNGTTASAAVLELSDFFAGVPNPAVDSGPTGDDAGPVADTGPTDASPTPESDASDSATSNADSSVTEAGTATDAGGASDASSATDAGSANDAAASDAGFEGISVSIDGTPTTFGVNPTLTYSSTTMTTTIQADDGTGTFWRFQLVVMTTASQQCSPFLQPSYPVITYTHYTSDVVDTTFTTKHQGASCLVQVSATATMTGQHSTGTFTGLLDQVVDGGVDAGATHQLGSGSYDLAY